ncbi:MAG: response regulator [Microcoleaceae cyanobacterium]
MSLTPLNSLFSKTLAKVPLQVALTVPLVVPIVGAVSLVGYLSFRSGEKAVRNLIANLGEKVANEIEYHSYNYLEKPHQIHQSILSAIYNKDIDINNYRQLQCYFWQSVKQPNLINHIGIGKPNGDVIAVEREFEHSLDILVEIRDQYSNLERETYQLDSQCNLSQLISSQPYDARERSWYQTAITAGKPTWSPFYLSASKSRLGLSAVTPLYTSQQQLLGVLHSEVTLDRFAAFLHNLEISSSGQALVIERSGNLIASTAESATQLSNGKITRKLISQSDSPLIQFISQQILEKLESFEKITQHQYFTSSFLGDKYLVYLTPLQDIRGLNWLIVVIIPEADFMQEIQANTHTTFVFCLFTLLVAILFGLMTTRWVIQPILRLNQSAKSLANRNWKQVKINLERSDELGELSESFNQMATQIQQYFLDLKSMNAALSASQRQLTHILEAVPVGVAVYDHAGNLYYANQTAQKLSGITISQDIETRKFTQGYPIYQAGTSNLYPPENLPITRALTGQQVYVDDLEVRQPHKTIILEAWATPIQDPSNKVISAISAFQDISERKKSELILAEQSKLAQFSSDVGLALAQTYTLDEILHRCTEAMVQHLNATFARIWFLNTQENILELRASSGLYTHLDGPHSRIPVGKFKIGLIAQERKSHITNNVFEDERVGDKEWAKREGIISFAGYPLMVEEKLVGVIAMFSQQKLPEIRLQGLELAMNTVALAIEQKISEQLLAESNKNLEKRVKERTAELIIAKEKAEIANQAKSTFIANMSHELRSPLNAILGFAQVMIRSQRLSQEDQENIGIIARSGDHLLTLINQVLDLSKIEAGHITLNKSSFNLYQFLYDLEDMFLLKADEKKLQLIFEIHPNVPQYIRSDEVKLRQILINLLNNALKFTTEGGICVRLSSKTNQHQQQTDSTEKIILYFEVEDTGFGIAPEELDSLFEAFVQTQAGQQAQEGTGLGLPISRKFIHLMQGDIQVQSKVNVGTLFKFRINVELADETEIETYTEKRRVIGLKSSQNQYKILAVDDKILNRQLLVKLLTPLGFVVKEACNGQEAIEVWQQWNPHLIWMDMRMPVMDGYEATRQIKSTTQGQATAVIALTASVFEEEKAMVLSAGCDDFMRKPFREVEIFDMMSKHIGVQYLYDNSNFDNYSIRVQDNDATILAALSALSPTLLESLKQAILRADLDLIEPIVNKIQQANPLLASTLQNNFDRFEYEHILTLISKV